MILAGTGHRPDKLGGYDQFAQDKVYRLAFDMLNELNPSTVISGMALGWDQALALAALDQGRGLWAFLPFAGQERKWPTESQIRYHRILDRATTVHIVSSGGFSVQAMYRRNQSMVRKCDEVLALYNGDRKGGTAHCIQYAKSQAKVIHNCWDRFMK